jgi:pimeloyl-ACP methyl ester carboxylesterase
VSTSTVVLVHGAFADAGSWRTTIPLVDAVDVIAAPNPLRGIAADTAYLDGLLDSFERELVLVGHSYGGAVISGVTRNAARVRALVFVAAYIPDEGATLTTAGDQERYPAGCSDPTRCCPARSRVASTSSSVRTASRRFSRPTCPRRRRP